MNLFSFLKVVFVGFFLMGAPALAQTLVGPDAEEQEVLNASFSEEADGASGVPTVVLRRPEGGVCPLPPDDSRLAKTFNLNKDVILCHAALAPLPQDVSAMLEWLKRPDVCGKGMQARPTQACALIFSALDDRFAPSEYLRPMTLTLVYRIKQNSAGEVVGILTIDPDGVIKRLLPEDFGWLVASEYKSVTRLIGEDRGDRRVVKVLKTERHCWPTTKSTDQCPHYIPVLGLGLGENRVKRVISDAAVKAHFSFDEQLQEDVEYAFKSMEVLENIARATAG